MVSMQKALWIAKLCIKELKAQVILLTALFATVESVTWSQGRAIQSESFELSCSLVRICNRGSDFAFSVTVVVFGQTARRLLSHIQAVWISCWRTNKAFNILKNLFCKSFDHVVYHIYIYKIYLIYIYFKVSYGKSSLHSHLNLHNTKECVSLTLTK